MTALAPSCPRRPRARLAALVAVSLVALAAACSPKNLTDVTASLGPRSAEPTTEQGWRAYTEDWARRYDADQTGKATSLNYARGLRALEQHAQAAAVLQQAAIRDPNDTEVLGAYGRALSDAGRLKEADVVLARAHAPERPDWRLLSAQGAVADQLGEHDRAERYYLQALKIVPDEPSVMSNLGLSYALANKLGEAERTLRQAADSARADTRVRQNLALVLGLQGKFDEAETVFRRDMSAEDATKNLAYLKQSVSQQNSWSAIKKLDAGGKAEVARIDDKTGSDIAKTAGGKTTDDKAPRGADRKLKVSGVESR